MNPSFQSRSEEPEQMDHAESDEQKLFNTLDQFASINRWFSQVRPWLRRHLLNHLSPAHETHVLDLGAGACDIPLWLLKEADKRGCPLRVTALDADPRVVRYAQERHRDVTGLEIVEGDAFDLSAFEDVDYIIGNHFLHHLPGDRIPELLAEAKQTARQGLLFTDLMRHPWSHRAFQLIGHLYRNSFAREDGLLSIRKGFRAHELRPICDPLHLAVREAFPYRIIIHS